MKVFSGKKKKKKLSNDLAVGGTLFFLAAGPLYTPWCHGEHIWLQTLLQKQPCSLAPWAATQVPLRPPPLGLGQRGGLRGWGAQPYGCSPQRLGAPKLGRPGGLARAPHGSILSRTGQVRPVPALLYGDFAVLPHGPHRRPRPNKNHLGTAVLVEGTLERLCKCHAALCSEPFLSDAFYCPPEKGTHQEGMGTARRTTVGFL